MRIEIKRICVPSDFSQPAERALHYGAALAHEHKADLHLLHVLQDFGDAVLHPDFTASGEEARVYFNERERAEMQGEDSISLYKDILNVFLHDAATKVYKLAIDALNSIEDEDNYNNIMNAIKILTKTAPLNIKDARRRLADKLIAENKYFM